MTLTVAPSPPNDEQRRLEREVRRLRFELEEAVRVLPHLRQMVQFSGDLLLLLGPEGRILEVNDRLAAVLGVPQASLYNTALTPWIANPGQAKVLLDRLLALAPGEPLRMELQLQPQQRHEEPLSLELEAHRLREEPSGEARWTLSLRDISERRRLESSEAMREVQQTLIGSLRSSEARYRNLVSQLADGLGQIDASTTVLLANPALERLLGVPADGLVGRRLEEFVAPEARSSFGQIRAALLANRTCSLEVPLLTADGEHRLVALDLRPQFPAETVGQGGVVASVLLRDVTELRQAVAELTQLAFFDPLTGLTNAEASRRQLVLRLARPDPPPQLVLWLDIEGFRRVNHSFGRSAGDALLGVVAERLRTWSGPGDLVARMGGDEFLLVRDLDHLDQAEALVQELVNHLLEIDASVLGQPMRLRFSGGYSLDPLHGHEAEELLQAAATALTRARDIAPGTLLRYEPSFTAELRTEMALEARLAQALQGGDSLRLVYQPQFDGGGSLVGCEALVRWSDPDLGVIDSSQFIPVAERSDLIHRLGYWVLDRACREQSGWLAAGFTPPRLAVNISPRQFDGCLPSLPDQVVEVLERHGLQPRHLELEITESCILPMVGAIQQVERLARLGICFALDDFGTGYSSLELLNRLPVHKLKIDQSFVAQLESSSAARTIVRTAVAMGQGLGLSTLAEGVETPAQLAVLETIGCGAFQGFLLSHPLEAEAYGSLLAAQGGPGDGAPLWRPAA